jgi:hypothetical protein
MDSYLLYINRNKQAFAHNKAVGYGVDTYIQDNLKGTINDYDSRFRLLLSKYTELSFLMSYIIFKIRGNVFRYMRVTT